MPIPKGLDIPEAYKVPITHDLQVDWSEHLPKNLEKRIRLLEMAQNTSVESDLYGGRTLREWFELEEENIGLKAQIAALEDTLS